MDMHGAALRRNDKHWTLEEQLAGRRKPTQVKRALMELGIRTIYAMSPQAKGRVERLWGTPQDRLVSAIRLRQVRTVSEANKMAHAALRHENDAGTGNSKEEHGVSEQLGTDIFTEHLTWLSQTR